MLADQQPDYWMTEQEIDHAKPDIHRDIHSQLSHFTPKQRPDTVSVPADHQGMVGAWPLDSNVLQFTVCG
jgi:hypothetical protein